MKTLRVILAAGVLTAIAGTTFADEQVVRESAYAFPSFLNQYLYVLKSVLLVMVVRCLTVLIHTLV